MAQVQLPGHGNQSFHFRRQLPCEAHYGSNPTFPTVLGTGLVTLMLLLLTEPGFAATNSSYPAANTRLRQSPPWASRMQSRASLNPALREAWNTNVTSLTAGRTAPQARQNLVLDEVGPNHRSWKREADPSAPASLRGDE